MKFSGRALAWGERKESGREERREEERKAELYQSELPTMLWRRGSLHPAEVTHHLGLVPPAPLPGGPLLLE